jgi:hypothetical protein
MTKRKRVDDEEEHFLVTDSLLERTFSQSVGILIPDLRRLCLSYLTTGPLSQQLPRWMLPLQIVEKKDSKTYWITCKKFFGESGIYQEKEEKFWVFAKNAMALTCIWAKAAYTGSMQLSFLHGDVNTISQHLWRQQLTLEGFAGGYKVHDGKILNKDRDRDLLLMIDIEVFLDNLIQTFDLQIFPSMEFLGDPSVWTSLL